MRKPQFRKYACIRLFIALLLTSILHGGHAVAFDKLTDAQAWIYDRGHLANTSQGQILTYRYASQDDAYTVVDDEASLSVDAEHDDGRRDVQVDFLTDERHLPLPPFPGYKGNPVIIAMLEHIAQSISKQTGGGALYFRNRIRDALASDEVVLETFQNQYEKSDIAGTRITFYPFQSDPHLGTDELIRDARFSIELSDDVPGGVIGIQVLATREDNVFSRALSLL